MATGIRATVEFAAPDLCPLTRLSAAAGTTVDSVVANVSTDGCTECVTEFSVEADGDAVAAAGVDVTPVFSDGPARRYRLSHDGDATCPCERLGGFGCPIVRYVAREGTLTLVFHAADYDQLQAAIADLRERFPDMDITRFIRSPDEKHARDTAFVDRSRLTARQLEVLETAHEMGYFERPRRANATAIADELDIAPSTFREHLAAAERKLLEDVL